MSGAPALVLIDLQKAIDDPSWGARNNPQAEKRIVRLLTVWRQTRWPLFHIRHDSRQPNSTYRPGQPLHAFKPETAPREGELVLAKQTCSAFASTDLAERLRAAGAPVVFVCGVITNNSVEATVRAGSDLGFRMFLVEDACFTFGKGRWTAQDVHEMSLANLEGEYATITNSARLVTTYLEHIFTEPRMAGCLRSAAAAKFGNAGEAAVLAALLGDLPRHFPGVKLRTLGFSEQVATLVDLRDATLRYLAARPTSRQTLTADELRLVEQLGGPMDEFEAEVFGDSTLSFSLLRLRYFEEQASKMHAPYPDFSTYRDLVEAHLSGTPSQQR